LDAGQTKTSGLRMVVYFLRKDGPRPEAEARREGNGKEK
jgi:hypothetical protein